ncbi:MAG: type II CAAX endopeptidase family protein [Leuconostoc falkenbergense]|uniref:CPBP family intramembrane glutamic endopeptidase n=1 Tax=Leuconostoc falkenbergense TaxID=2766470 RepID=UPI0039EB624C
MLEMTETANPKSLWLRIINFGLVIFLMMFAPAFLGLASASSVLWEQILWASVMVVVYIAIGIYAYRLLKATAITPIFQPNSSPKRKGFWWLVGMWLLMLAIELTIANLRVNLTGETTTANEEAINQLTSNLNVTMIAMIIYAVILAPVVEELVFRGLVLNYFLRRNWWWGNIILSGVIFAFPHMGLIPTTLSDGLSYLMYASMGMVLAYVYKKTGAIQNNIAIHMLNNGVTMIPLLLLAINKMQH